MVNPTQMLKGILEGCILKIVAISPCYSKEIVEKLKKYGFASISEGTLFPLLLRLEKEGLFETAKVSNPLGPSRKYYTLSHKGQLELRIFTDTWENFSQIVNAIVIGKEPEDESI